MANVKATWVGPFVAELSDGTALVPGETVVSVGEDEAKASDNWAPVAKKQPPKGDD